MVLLHLASIHVPLELNFLLFTLRLLSQSGLLSLTVLTSINRQKRCS